MADDFGEDISTHSDDELLEIVNVRFADYAPAVVAGAKRELENRGFKLLRTGADFEIVSPSGDTLSPPVANSDDPDFDGSPAGAHNATVVSTALVDFRYKGVGGWLMFFVITLILIRPLTLCASLGRYEQVWGPHYAAYPFLKVIRVVNLIVGLGAAGFSIYAGVGLLRVWPHAVQVAKTYLVVTTIALILTGPLLLLSGFPEAANSEILGSLPLDALKSLLYPTVWYLYLSNSKRVATTYTS